MNDMETMAKILIGIGLLILITGAAFLLFSKIGTGFRLPGDIYIKKDNFTFYFPLATGLLLSLIITIILNLIARR